MNRVRLWILAVLTALPLPAAAQVVASDIAIVQDLDGKITEAVSTPDGYLALASKAFYKTHADRYNAVFVFSAVDISGMLTNVQQGWPVRQDIKGIGRMTYNSSMKFGSTSGNLRQAVKMGDINVLGDDPDQTYTGILFFNGLTNIELMAHEFGHHWMASLNFKTPDGVTHCMDRAWEGNPEPQVGENLCDGWGEFGFNQHWSYFFNSRSIMYGMFYEETGPGTFKMWYDQPKFSELDQYIMGLRGADEVSPMFALVDADGYQPSGSASMPQRIKYSNAKEVQFTRFDFTIQDIIRENGEREWIPKSKEPCHWKGAMILITSPKYPATPKLIDKMVRYANRWEEFYDYATDHRGSFDMTLDGRGAGTATCPSGTVPPPPVDPGPEPLEDTGGTSEEVVATDVIGPQDDGPMPPDWSNYDFGGDSPVSDPGTPPRDGTEADPGTSADVPTAGTCTPNARKCDGSVIRQCTADGTGWAWLSNCADGGLICVEDGVCGQPSKKGGGCAGGPTSAGPAGWILLALPLLALAARRRTARDR